MSSKIFNIQKKLGAQYKSDNVMDDTPVAIRIKYRGTGSVTSVTPTAATGIVLISSDGGTESFLYATYATIGAVVDAINCSPYWDAKVLDALRADASADKMIGAGSALTITSDGYYDIYSDTDAVDAFTYRITANRDTSVSKPQKNHCVKLAEVTYTMNIDADTASGFKVYEYDPKGDVETLVYRRISIDNVLTTVNWADGEGTITAKNGNDLIVRISGTTLSTGAGNFADFIYIVE